MSFLKFRNKAKQLKTAKILILGLDSAGKTTLSRYLRFGEFQDNTVPTIGQNIDTFKVENWTITAIDVAGQQNFRFLWESHYHGSSAIIFVIDSADFDRLPEAKQILRKHVFDNPFLEKVPVLIMANKQDLPGSIEAPLLVQLLDLHNQFLDRTFSIFDCSILYGGGITESFEWLVNQLENQR